MLGSCGQVLNGVDPKDSLTPHSGVAFSLETKQSKAKSNFGDTKCLFTNFTFRLLCQIGCPNNVLLQNVFVSKYFVWEMFFYFLFQLCQLGFRFVIQFGKLFRIHLSLLSDGFDWFDWFVLLDFGLFKKSWAIYRTFSEKVFFGDGSENFYDIKQRQ